MTTGDAILRAVFDSPYDDTPRLVFADWLEEHGDPLRAEFIRLQCELAGQPDCERPEFCGGDYENCPACARVFAADDRHTEVWGQIGTRLSLPLVGLGWSVGFRGINLGRPSPRATFNRGFVAWTYLTAADFTARHDHLFKTEPVASVFIEDIEPASEHGGAYVFTAERLTPHLPESLARDIVGAEFRSRDAALSGLNGACVDWARRQVGLGPLHRWLPQ